MKSTATGLRILSLAFLTGACQPLPPDSGTRTAESPVLPRSAHGEISSLSFEDFFMLHESGKDFLIDARQAYFYQLGRIPGATHLPAKDCDPRIAAMKPALDRAVHHEGKTLVVYCNGFGCGEARTVARHLSRDGYPVSVFSGGWRAWKNAGLPVESASQATPSSATSSAP